MYPENTYGVVNRNAPRRLYLKFIALVVPHVSRL